MLEPALPSAKNDKTALTGARLLDRVEQIAVILLYSMLVVRIWPGDFSTASIVSFLLLISEGVVVAFLLIRKPTSNISLRPNDWLVATAGTCLPLLVSSGGAQINLEIGAVLLIIGMMTHIGAKFSLNRSFGLVAANRGVKQRGLYRFVRHPMYAGYMMSQCGYFLASASWWNLSVYAALWTFLLLRIRAEERVLSQDAAYREFAGRVRFRLLPGLY